jgi:hypothetical protein
MGKVLKTIGKIILWILIAIIALLMICGVVNKIMQQNEKDLLKDDRCTMVEVDGKNMSLYTDTEKDHTILHLSGWMPDLKAHYSTQKNDNKTFMIELNHR